MAAPRRPQNIDNTGYAGSSSAVGGRLVNRDGSNNLRKSGLPFWKRVSIYHSLLRLPRWQFLGVVMLFYTTMNFIFAGLYLLNGVQHLHGVELGDGPVGSFLQAFFFSSQTLTTVGYGHISPEGFGANIIASIESFTGILSFALVTGMLYARFTRPRAYLRFSDAALIAPYGSGTGLMVRVVSFKNNHLTDVEAAMTLALRGADGATRFYPLPLQISTIASLALSWTVNHPIDEASPLWNLTESDLQDMSPELIVNVKGFDDHFSTTVQQRTSYTSSDILFGARFIPMFHRTPDRKHTELEIDKISTWERVKILNTTPETAASPAMSS